MASDVSICNVALRKTASGRIASLTEGTKNANACTDIYVDYRDDLLRGHPWNFAIMRAKLARESAVPTFGYDFQYTLPADHLRTIQVFDNDAGRGTVDHKEEDGRILTSVDDVYLLYVRRVEDANVMPPDFREALACKMAVTLAVTIAESRTMAADLREDMMRAIRTAKSTDALSDRPTQRPRGSWADSRQGRRGRWPL